MGKKSLWDLSEKVFDFSELERGGVLALMISPSGDRVWLTDSLGGNNWDIPIKTAKSMAQHIQKIVDPQHIQKIVELHKADRL